MQVLGLDEPIAAESGWPRSLSFSKGFWPSSLPLFHGVTRPLVFVVVSMNRSFVEVKELHVDRGRRALVDPEPSRHSLISGRSTLIEADVQRSVVPAYASRGQALRLLTNYLTEENPNNERGSTEP